MHHIRPFLLALAIAPMAFPVAAETVPRALFSDPRIKQFAYDEFTVYRLDVHMRFLTTLQFENGEQISSISLGDSASWQVVPLNRGDVITVKPLIRDARTSMTVFTDRRVYTFELRSHETSRTAPAHNFRTVFVYPTETVSEFRSVIPSSVSRNTDYFVAGNTGFAPSAVFDNGRQTFFEFPEKAPRPAIFSADALGNESLVNVRPVGNRLVVDKISDRWTFRIGQETLCIASGDVVRTIPGTPRPAGTEPVALEADAASHATAQQERDADGFRWEREGGRG